MIFYFFLSTKSSSDDEQQRHYSSAEEQRLRADGEDLYNANPAATCLAFEVLLILL